MIFARPICNQQKWLPVLLYCMISQHREFGIPCDTAKCRTSLHFDCQPQFSTPNARVRQQRQDWIDVSDQFCRFQTKHSRLRLLLEIQVLGSIHQLTSNCIRKNAIQHFPQKTLQVVTIANLTIRLLQHHFRHSENPGLKSELDSTNLDLSETTRRIFACSNHLKNTSRNIR